MKNITKSMGKAMVILTVSAALLSCEALFTTNIFETLDTIDLSDLSAREQAVAVLDDPDLVDDLSDSEVDDLLDELIDLYNNSSDDNTQMQAAAAASTVYLNDSGADDTINNLSGLATDMVGGDLEIDDPGDILTAIFSDSSGNPLPASEIEAQLDAMLASAAALEAYGSVLGEDGEAPAGVSADELGVTALVVGMVDVLITAGNTTNDIAAIIADPDGAADVDANGVPDVFDSDLPDMSVLTADNAMSGIFGADLANTIEGSGMVSGLLDMMG